ncbi:MAG: YihY/virulence factor BrkB family protein [Candidatus Eremiobacteraeota bacterium]|nr:YihY/virulence factor BrkB family protein [Candidatus Eremiobacteraeota bacterium]
MQSVVGASASQAVIDLIDATLREQKQGIVAAAISWTVMILGAIGLVGALQDALNTVWHVEGPKRPGIAGLVRGRLAALALVAASAFVLLVSLVANVGLAALGDQLHGLFPASGALVNLLDFAVSFGVIALLFWVIFTYLPDAETKWRDTLHGAIISALLFVAGQFALGWYLGRVGTASAYGAAGSLVVILLWTFYSAQILLFGAEFTVVTASRARRSLAQSRRSASGRRSEPEAS